MVGWADGVVVVVGVVLVLAGSARPMAMSLVLVSSYNHCAETLQ
jgi:hypothetical protein